MKDILCHTSDAQKYTYYLYQIAKILHQTLLAFFYSMETAASTYCPFCLDLANILAFVTSVLQNNPKGLTSCLYLAMQ